MWTSQNGEYFIAVCDPSLMSFTVHCRFGLLEDEIEKLFCHQVDVVLATAALESLKPFMFINTNDLPHVIVRAKQAIIIVKRLSVVPL